MICCACEREGAFFTKAGHEELPLCVDCSWGADDINKANEECAEVRAFWNKMNDLGVEWKKNADGTLSTRIQKPKPRN